MLSKWPIRNKLIVGICILLVIVATLSLSGFSGIYAYRSLARGLRSRAAELPTAAKFAQQVSDLRVTAAELRSLGQWNLSDNPAAPLATKALSAQFDNHLEQARKTLNHYREQLRASDEADSQLSETQVEWESFNKLEDQVNNIAQLAESHDWFAKSDTSTRMVDSLAALQQLSGELPRHLHQNLRDVPVEARSEYRTLIVVTWFTTVSAGLLLGLLIKLFYSWVFRPLRVLVKGSRRVAAGEFDYRISLQTQDEMSELAEAMNDMTARFRAIRDDLDRQVQERTKQVVRSEQLASVGFLAAGVAHEINNPLASIAMCSESLEGRIEDILQSAGASDERERDVVRTYLRMIQDEAFRCKGITERLLDFSRMGDMQRHNADLRELVQGVIDMVGHLGKYHDKHVEFVPGDGLIVPINAQEIKQVVLNMITNGLDALNDGGAVRIELTARNGQAHLTFTDNGCGMTDEVRQHLFEPFFTRRRTGQGIGLGLSITYRIVTDHGGQIDVHSDGPGHGSRFCVRLPLAEKQKEHEYRYQAA